MTEEFWLGDGQMGAAGAVVAEQPARGPAGRRPASDQRHHSCAEIGLPVGRRAGALRAAQDIVQPVRPLGGEGCLARGVRGAGRRRRAAREASARQLGGEGAPLCSRRQRGELNQAIGRSRGGRTTKIHALADGCGRPLAFLLTGGQAADCQAAEPLLARVPVGIVVHADRGYDTNRVRLLIEGRGRAPNIPPRSHRRWKNCFSPYLYRGRNAIERMFGRLKDFRRIVTRYDKLAVNFLAAVHLAATVSYWL